MKTTLALVALLALQACAASMPSTADVRAQAIKLTDLVNEQSDRVDSMRGVIVFVCNVRGTRSAECGVLEDGYDVAGKAVDAAHAMVRVYDATGAGLAAVDGAIRAIATAIEALDEEITHVTEAMKHAAVAPNSTSSGGSGEGSAGGGPAASEAAAATAGGEEPAPARPQ